MKYLVAGGGGQLATEFVRRFEALSADFLAPDIRDLDITDAAGVSSLVDQCRPDVVINCAAYNLVDRAEVDRSAAFWVNAEGPRLLAWAAARYGARFVHFGTDYVFDGRKEDGLYIEEDAVGPINEYGRGKLAGEAMVFAEHPGALIYRLSWVFGPGDQNFIKKLLDWQKKSPYLRVACDEFSVPTSTATVVDVVLRSLDQGLAGLYHLTNTGYCSRYEYARHILKCMGINKFVRPVSMDIFDLPARRPRFSAMGNGRISGLLDISIADWEDAVRTFLEMEGRIGS